MKNLISGALCCLLVPNSCGDIRRRSRKDIHVQGCSRTVEEQAGYTLG